MGILRWLSVLILCFVATACGTSRLPVADQGRSVTFDSGSPLVDIEALPREVNDEVRLQVTWGVMPASLVRTREESRHRGMFRSRILVRPLGAVGEVASYGRSDTLIFASESEAATYSPELLETTFELPAGSYEVLVSVEDLVSRAVARRAVKMMLPADDQSTPVIGSIHLSRPGNERVITSFHYPAEFDSLRITAAAWGEGDSLRLRLVRLQSDTTVAEAPLWPTGMRRDLVALGVTLVESAVYADVSWSGGGNGDERSVVTSGMRPGYYRATLSVDGQESARRDFVVREPGFPAVDRLSVMVDALEYLATKDELAAIRSATNDTEMKSRFDSFWASAIPERARAAQTIARYYERVEEANRLFSGVKDGWKTDRGMLFIVRGAPLMLDKSIDQEIWYYSYREPMEGEVYVFDNTSIPGLDHQLRTYTLRRHVLHASEWRRAVDAWRRGARR